MKENKGFTLLELLAVIVVLAIIALIVTPFVTGAIKQARKGAAEINNLKTVNANLNEEIANLKTANTNTNTEITNLKTTTTSQATKITSLEANTTNSSIFLKSYPVGSIYISLNSTNPGATYGGTWVAYGTGRTLVGVDTTQTEFNTISKTGGVKTHLHSTANHTLTIAEMPNHSHTYTRIMSFASSKDTAAGGNYGDVVTNTSAVGGSQPHNHGNTSAATNLMPYITVYMWRRTN